MSNLTEAPTKPQQIRLVSQLHDMLTKAQEQIVNAQEIPHQLTMLMTFDDLLEEVQDHIRKIEKVYPKMKGGE